MSLKKHYLSAFILAVILLTACKKETYNPTVEIDTTKSSLIKISEAYAIGSATKVELWSDSEISTGYQKLYVALYDSITKKPVTRSIVEILPIIDKKINDTFISYSVPIENPESFDATETLFQCAAVFTTPTYGDLTQWRIKIRLKKAGQNEFAEVQMPIYVKPSTYERVKTIVEADGTKLTIAFVSPLYPKLDLNDFEIIINHTADLFTYHCDNSHSIDISAEMPLNKVISSNNVNPIYDKNGHYKGKVNLTKNGKWRININLTKDGKTVSTFFDISV
ncbi:hypothetical protein SAMN05421813_11329 [Daejeonella rubra]|uniref:YtkA-like n=1 Tax=Daejeonella rubra TaxID=990371 RepID=A0A1G9TI14_9SPHI|nr:hypothetical protein [Daejeonella rubra]SDM47320.1 hypothetical protein SAMN05421813_11329 [Daejeonella rubra]